MLYEYSKKVKPIDGYEDIAIHDDWLGFSINNLNGNEIESYTPKKVCQNTERRSELSRRKF